MSLSRNRPMSDVGRTPNRAELWIARKMVRRYPSLLIGDVVYWEWRLDFGLGEFRIAADYRLTPGEQDALRQEEEVRG